MNQISGKIRVGEDVLATMDGHWVCPPPNPNSNHLWFWMFGTKAEPLLKALCVVFDGVGMLRLSEVLHQPQNKQMFDLQHADMILKF